MEPEHRQCPRKGRHLREVPVEPPEDKPDRAPHERQADDDERKGLRDDRNNRLRHSLAVSPATKPTPHLTIPPNSHADFNKNRSDSSPRILSGEARRGMNGDFP